MPGEEASRLGIVLLLQHGAGDIGDSSARFERGHSAVEDFGLLLLTLFQRARPHSPFGIGVAAPGADAGARRIDQHEVHSSGEIADFVADGLWRANLDVAVNRALQPLVYGGKPSLVIIGCEDLPLVLHHRPIAKVLPPAPAQRS